MPRVKRSRVTYDEGKLTELMLYIAKRTETDSTWDQIKFNKALFYSDFAAFASTGRAITGATYIKKERGPVLKQMLPMRSKLRLRKTIYEHKWVIPTGAEIVRLVPTREPNMKKFTPETLKLVDFVVNMVQAHSSREISELSHAFMGWRLAELGGEISYSTVVLPPDPMPVAPRDIAHGKKIAARLNKEAVAA